MMDVLEEGMIWFKNWHQAPQWSYNRDMQCVRLLLLMLINVRVIMAAASSKELKDQEQDLIRNQRHWPLMNQWSNHRHRQHWLFHPLWSISMSIWSPIECVRKPLIGFNHMNLMACREGNETSMRVECNVSEVIKSHERKRWDVLALGRECL